MLSLHLSMCKVSKKRNICRKKSPKGDPHSQFAVRIIVIRKEVHLMPRKGENIYKRKDGRWEGRYIKSRTPAGKANYGYVYAKTYREVKSKLVNQISFASNSTTECPRQHKNDR